METVDRTKDGGRTAAESAQVIIIAGFLLAIGIVAITVLLNSLIFSQDLASRDDTVNERPAVQFEQQVREVVNEGMIGTGGTPSDARDEYQGTATLIGGEGYIPGFYNSTGSLNDRFAQRQSGFEVDAGLSDVTLNEAWMIAQSNDGRFNNSAGAVYQGFPFDGQEGNWVVAGSMDESSEEVGNPYRVQLGLNATSPEAGTSTAGVTLELRKEEDGGILSDTYDYWAIKVEARETTDTARVATYDETDSLGPHGESISNLSVNPDEERDFDIGNADLDRVEVTVIDRSPGASNNVVALALDNESSVIDRIELDPVPDPAETKDIRISEDDFDDGAKGTYDIRVDEDVQVGNESEDEIGVCADVDDGEPCRYEGDGTSEDVSKFVTGVVHRTDDIGIEYFDRKLTYENTIDVALDKDRVVRNREMIPAIDGGIVIDSGSLTATVSNPEEGDDVPINVTVVNNGQEESSAEVEFEVSEEGSTLTEASGTENTDDLDPDESETIQWTGWQDVDEGAYEVTAFVDDDGVTSEETITVEVDEDTGNGGNGGNGGGGGGGPPPWAGGG